MTCADHQRTINRFIDHEIKATECAELFGHLGTCMECRRFYDAILTLGAELDEIHLTIDEMPAIRWRPRYAASRQPGHLITNQNRIAPRPSSLLFAIVVMVVVALLFSVDVRIEKPAQDRPPASASLR